MAKNPLSRSGANELAEIVKFRKIDTLASMERTQPLDSMKMLTETLPEVSQRMMTWNYERRQHVNNSHQFILFYIFYIVFVYAMIIKSTAIKREVYWLLFTSYLVTRKNIFVRKCRKQATYRHNL